MDQKCMRTPVFTFETIFKDSAEVPIDIDFNMPDYCPEISKILKCRATARISSKRADSRNITVDGGVTVTVIYCDEENLINSYEYQYPFSKTFETGVDIEDANITASAKCEYINCRAVTERKIDIHGAVGVNVTAARRKSRDIICDIDDENIEVMRSSAPATMPRGNSEKCVIIEDEIEIGGSQPDVRCLIRYDAVTKVGECKLLAGKAIIKGDITVSILYRSDEGETQSLSSEIPFSQLIEIEGVGEDCECGASAYIAYLEIKPKFNSSGESRAFSVDGKVCLKADAYCESDVAVITDAYSRKYAAQILSEEVCFNKLLFTVNDTFSCRKKLDLSPSSVSRVIDLWCDVRTDSVKFEGGCLCVGGTVYANVLALDEYGVPLYFEKPIEYEYSYKMPDSGENYRTEPDISVISANYNLLGDDAMEITMQMAINAPVYECRNVPLISDVVINENEPLQSNRRGAMTIYFAESGEKLWDIARKYLADINEMKRINSIEDEKLIGGQMIMIPVN